MSDKIHYRVDCFLVTLTPDNDPETARRWVDYDCECEEFAQSHALQDDNEKCKHIREAEMYHVYDKRVTPIQSSD